MPLPRVPQSTYYDSRNRPGTALYRARQPYIVKNAVAGLGLLAFTVAVYSYTLRAVSQDNFEDVVVPENPVSPPHAPHASAVTTADPSRLTRR